MSTQILNIDKNPMIQRVVGFLQCDSFDGFTSDDLFIMQFVKKGWGQDIAALSNMAEALMNASKSGLMGDSEVKVLLDGVVSRALHKKVSPYGKDPRAVENLGRYGYYLEHLNIILGCYQSAVDDAYLDSKSPSDRALARCIDGRG